MTRAGLSLIKQFEGCKLKAYKCPAGILTIGWGRATNVRPGDTCTQAQADAWLIQEYDSFETKVVALLGSKIAKTSANQLGALVSFSYNVGVGALKSSTLLKLHLAGDTKGSAAQFARWNKAAGRVLAGLTKRRAAEAALYLA